MWTLASARRYWSNVFCIATGINASYHLFGFYSNLISSSSPYFFPNLPPHQGVIREFMRKGLSTRHSRIFRVDRFDMMKSDLIDVLGNCMFVEQSSGKHLTVACWQVSCIKVSLTKCESPRKSTIVAVKSNLNLQNDSTDLDWICQQ